MDDLEKIWHHGRQDVAKQLLDSFHNTGNNKVVMFERRRRGKTDLLLYDVTPAAEEAGYQVIYVNIWDNSADPAGRILGEYAAALKPRSLRDRLAKLGRSPVETIKLGGELYGAKGELEVGLGSESQKVASSTLEALKDLADQLARRKRKTLLMIDEVQGLANESNLPLVRALRTQLETHKNRIHAIFTGSSREGLLHIFANKDAPFFRSSVSFTLPEMDRGFVQHLLEVFRSITQLESNEADAMRVFEQLRRNPYHFRKTVSLAVQLREPSIEKVLDVYRRRLPEEEGWLEIWRNLPKNERILLLIVAGGHSSIYAKEAAQAMEKIIGEPLQNYSIQKAAKGLMAKQLITKVNPSPLISDRTNYVVEDEEMGDWLRGDQWALPSSVNVRHK